VRKIILGEKTGAADDQWLAQAPTLKINHSKRFSHRNGHKYVYCQSLAIGVLRDLERELFLLIWPIPSTE
jgi:hypothetical protein